MTISKHITRFLVALFAGFLAGCGGGGSGGGAAGAAPTYSISGTVNSASGAALAGVRVSLSGPASATTTTDANGRYSFLGLSSGAYVVTPSLAGTTFSPAAQSIAVNAANVASSNFVAAGQAALIGSGIEFLPATFSSVNQLRASLVVKGGSVFFTDSSDLPLKKISLNNLAVSSLAKRMNTPESVVIQGQSTFWVDGGKLNQTALDGTSTTLLASGERDAAAGVTADVVVDNTNAYWVNTVSSSSMWIIQRVPLGGGAAVTLATVNRQVVALAGDANNIYWEEASLEPLAPGCQCGSSIKRVPKTGGATVVLVDGFLNGTLPPVPPGQIPGSWYPTGGLAVSGSDVVFGVSANSYDVKSIPIAGGAITTLASVATTAAYALNAIRDLSVGSGNVYWIDSGNRELDTVPVTGGAVTTVVSGIDVPSDLNRPVSLAVSSADAYWTDLGTVAGCCLRTEAGSIKTVSLSGGPITTLISGIDAPGALAVDAANLVWAETWRLGKAPVGGGAATTLASGISTDIARIAVDQTNIYVLDGDLIKKIPIAGGVVEKLSSAHGGNIGDISAQSHDIATDGSSVYWSVSTVASGPGVQKVPVNGGAVVTLAGGSAGSPQDCYWRIAVDAQNVYWSSTTSAFPIGCTVRKVPINGGAATTLVDVAYLRDFTVDATDVYFSELNSDSIRKTPIGGGASTPVATNAVAWVLTNDANNLYWVDSGPTGGIGQFAKSAAGGAFSGSFLTGPLATDPFLAAEGIAVGSDGLFWTETVFGDMYSIE